jgi:hypothetical protein
VYRINLKEKDEEKLKKKQKMMRDIK